ncbi:Domain of unknown function DUF4815 [uncultured Caudovirales phage]|uniref:DUF4815 domain-containing protein n=1 Tax=uncultured Caudovirales phage TaxID=2100421 RepID=A0A6J5T302_9CAUD|nr:Domain of unknown function DUF4815 [uncultured Caudovirales phage]
MALNFNTSPYFDDFDPTDNYHRILFKPGRAIQARELTQSQTILQNQISQFASAIYAQNTPISGGKITTNLNSDYLKLNRAYLGAAIDISELVGQIVTNSTGIISATIIAVSSDSSTTGDLPTLILSYRSGQKFANNMTLYIQNTPFATTFSTGSTGKASVVSISAGVFYVVNGYNKAKNNIRYSIGNFVNVLPQTIILNKYSNTPSVRVGLDILEHIVNSSTDSTLLDPALGASNYQAPGADRYQITLTLITKPFQIGNDDGFIELMRMENGIIIKQVDHTVYSTIDDYFAKRDFESNGNYIVNDFKLSSKTNIDGNGDKYDFNIGKGVAYVQGYRIENQSNLKLTSDRARTKKTILADNTYINFGNYFTVDTVNGSFDFTKLSIVDLHCVPYASIDTANTNTYKSTLIGNAYIRNMDYQTGGTDPNGYIFNSFVSDINTVALTGNATNDSTNSKIVVNASAGRFSDIVNAYVGCAVEMTAGPTNGEKKIITTYVAANNTIFVNSPFNTAPDGNTQFKIILSTTATDSIVKRTLPSSTTNYNLTAKSNINSGIGKVGGLVTGSTILHSAGNPEMIYTLGYPYVANVSNTQYYSTQIFRNVAFNGDGEVTINTTNPIRFQGNDGVSYDSDGFNQLFTVTEVSTGNILAFNDAGNSVTILTESSAKFTAPSYGTKVVNISAAVFIPNADDSKILKVKELTVGNTSFTQTLTNPNTVTNRKFSLDIANNPTGQVLIAKADINSIKTSLNVSDVKRITKIIDVGTTGLAGPSGALSNYSDITSDFLLDNGQEDSYYGHSHINLLPGVSRPIGDILVVFDYYLHSGGDGYFSAGSYLNSPSPEASIATIPSFTASSGKIYKLSDCIDFRPSFKNATSADNWEFTAVTNSNGINIQGALIPNNLSNFQSDYQYYLARKDKLVLTKDGSFLIIEGTPANVPNFPSEPNGSMILANITLDPYTAYVSGEGPSYVDGLTQTTVPPNLNIAKVLHKRWAKSDITELQHQVDNLEYYTALSLLEHKTNAMQVPDVNGLNRFKNGILVDSFVDFGTADTANPDFECNINIREQKLTPVQDVGNFILHNSAALKSYGKVSNTATYHMSSTPSSKLFTLPYNKQIMIKQTLASNTISVNPFNVVLYEGKAYLNPPMDTWINVNQPADIHITHPGFQFAQTTGSKNVINCGDWKALSGTEAINASPQGYMSEDGIVKNTAISAYIQSQEIIVRATGMLENTPVDCWFDGKNVNKYMTQANTIELQQVVGTFQDDDIIGFFDDNIGEFFPIARVISVINYNGGTRVHLNIAHLINPPATVATTHVINANFDVNGNYTGTDAIGVLIAPAGSIQTLHNKGSVKAVGGTWTSVQQETPSWIFKSHIINPATTFLNTYGVWGDQNNSASYTATFPFTVTTAGAYTLSGSHNGTVGTLSIDDVVKIATLNGTTKTVTLNLTAGPHKVSWVTTKAANPAIGAVAVTIGNASGLIWDSNDPNELTYPNSGHTRLNLQGGGTYYMSPSQISLDAHASGTSDTAYVGASITFSTTYVYEYKYGSIYVPPKPGAIAGVQGDGDAGWQAEYQARLTAYNAALAAFNAAYAEAEKSKNTLTYLTLTKNYTTDIETYDHLTRTITVNPLKPVNISVGWNKWIAKDITSTYTMSGIQLSVANAIHEGNTISKLSTTSDGKFVGLFNIPGSKFNTGSKIFRIDNRIDSFEPNSATTFSEATFLAGNSNNNENFGSPSHDSSSKPFNKFNIVNTGNSSAYDPIAQTFIVDGKSYPNGVFIKSVKLFFAHKDEHKDVTISIVGTVNGFPSGKILDNSTVSKHPNQVKVSLNPHYLDATSYTEFEFTAPIYLKQDILYAIIVQSASSVYDLWLAKQNQLAVASTTSLLPGGAVVGNPKIGATPYCGALFESQGGLSWTADLSSDLMFTIDQCIFDKTQTPTLDFSLPKGLPRRKLGTHDILYGIDHNLAKNINSKFQKSKALDAFNLSTTDFIPSPCKIRYQYSATLMNQTVTPPVSVTPGRYGMPTAEDIHLDDGLGQRVLLEDRDNSFQLFATLSSTDKYVSPIIADDGVSIFDIVYFINNLGISSEKISIVSGGTGYNAATTSITVSSPNTKDGTNAVLGFTTNTTTGIINSVYVEYPGSGYTKTPTITVTDAATRSGNSNASIIIHGETSSHAGNGFAKYVTKTVTLTPGSDSGDMRVYYTAYKPLGTEVYVYYKILNSNDTSKFADQNWQLMTQTSNSNVFSKDRTKLIEYEWAPGINNSADNNISYTSTNGVTYTNYITFAIKIVMATNDNTKVPFLTDIRALALPSGTGI